MRKATLAVIGILMFSSRLALAGALSPTQAWLTQGVRSEAQFGTAISASDFNRDGFKDVMVGSSNAGGNGNGTVYIYHGSASGLPATATSMLSGTGSFGRSLAAVGDVNGDGFPDAVIGAPENGGTLQGMAWLYLGTASGLGTSALSLQQNNRNAYQQFGTYVGALGDVNGDGRADWMVTCNFSCDGSAYIYYGASPAPTTPSLVFNGGQSGASVMAMDAAGDVNGDGYGDVIARLSTSRAALYLGSAAGIPTTPSWFVDRTGTNAAWFPFFAAGDVNHDGYADLGVMTSGDSATQRATLAIYAGSPSGPTLLQTLNLSFYLNYGMGVGDVDGDGFGDLVLGAPGYSNGQNGEGRAFLYRGSAAGVIDQVAWTGESNNASSAYGQPIAGADVNGDGRADVVIGALYYFNHGAAFAYHGTSATCTTPNPPSGLTVTAPANNQLSLSWTAPAGGADHYVIYRSLSDCATAQPQHLNETSATSYLDTTAIAGAHYAYTVTAATAANTCESAPSNCDEKTSTGTCTTPPTYSGLGTVTENSCGFTLNWSPATNNCPGSALRYNVYYAAGVTSFTPFPSNRIASCVAGNTFDALGLGTGSFIVRAANDNGSGGCVNEETNTTTRFIRSSIDFTDTLETVSGSWIASSDVSRSTCRAYSGTYSYRVGTGFFCNAYNPWLTATLVLAGRGNTNGFLFQPYYTNLRLTFQQFFNTEAGRDGAQLQYSRTSANGPFTPILDSPQAGEPYIISGGYTGTVSQLANQRGWSGTNGSFNQVTVNLDALAGSTVWFRWVFVSDGSVSADGYFVDSVTISGRPSALTAVSVTPSGPATVCWNAERGPTLTATPNGGAPWVYDWGYRTVPGGPVTTISNFHQPTWPVFPNQYPGAGTYYAVAIVSGTCGGTVVSNEVPITIASSPQAAITPSGPTTFCAGGSVTLTASSGASYLWSTGATTQSIVVNATGDYTVTVTDGNGCSTASPAQHVTVSAPSATITPSGPTTFCQGGSVTLSASAAASYLWSTGATTQSINVTQSGSYSVTVTDANGCSATSAPTAVTVNALPTATITPAGPTTFCAGGSVTLTASAGASYLWSTGATTQSVNVTQSGSYTVTVTDANGCSATSAATAVTVNALPQATITPSGLTTFCAGGSVTLTASAGASYLWSNGATTQSIDVTQSGSYTVTVTGANGCAATSSSMAVTVNALPSPAITPSGPTTFCQGGSVTLSASAAASYLWSTGATTQSINVTQSGSYSVTVTDANGCSATSAATAVTVNALPSAVITPSGPTTFCADGSVTLSASAGTSYLWSNGATTQSIDVTQSGSYTVTVTGANGCSATSAATAVTVNALPNATITPSGPTTFCQGGSVTLSASAGASYLWSNGATTQSINATQSGSYSVTVTDANGCSATSAATAVTVNALPSATITPSGPTTFCQGGSVTLSASAGASYLWSTGATTQSINVTQSGSYTVTVTDANGCSATSAATGVTVDALPNATITPSGPTTFCQGGSVTLSASAGTSYLWSNGATTQSITVTQSGSYTVTVTNANGCSATSPATAVTVNALPSATITPSGPTTFCQGGSVTLTASAGTSYLWSNGATTQSITVNASGSYSVTVTNANGCSATSPATAVTVNSNPAVPAVNASGPTTFCQGGSVTLTAPAGFTYLWSTGATTQAISATASGNYSVTVTNASGCSSTSAPVAVTVNPATAISQQPPNQTIPRNTSATMTVLATGTGTLTYQWFKGASGVTNNPINGATSATYTTPHLGKGTYTYWVRVTGTCGTVASNTITITAQ